MNFADLSSETTLTMAIAAFIFHIGIGHKCVRLFKSDKISESMFNIYIASAFGLGYLFYRMIIGPMPGILLSGVATAVIYGISKMSRAPKKRGGRL